MSLKSGTLANIGSGQDSTTLNYDVAMHRCALTLVLP